MHIQTPLTLSRALSEHARADVWLKMEASQPAGSFKIRGIGHACRVYRDQGARRFISSSGGNAGMAVAYAGRELGLPVTVVVPQTTQQRSIELIQQQEAEVIVHGANWDAAHAHAQSLLDDQSRLIHPYDDPLLWEGHASLIDEVADAWDGQAPDIVLLSVGGGGLLCGVIRGLEKHGWTAARVLAAETPGAASFQAAHEAGELVTLDEIRTVAACLGARQVSRKAFEYGQRYDVSPVVVSDASAMSACRRFLDDHRTLVEPACGAAMAPVYEAHPALEGKRVLVIVCGGVGVTLAQLQAWLEQTGA